MSFAQREARANKYWDNLMLLLIRIRDDLDPEGFTGDEVDEEVGIKGGPKRDGMDAYKLDIDPKTGVARLLKEGLIESVDKVRYRITDLGSQTAEEAYHRIY